jgi:hypothetical protein
VIGREDHEVCERIQKIAHQIDQAPLIGALEERIVWFEESYRRIMLAGDNGPGGNRGVERL